MKLYRIRRAIETGKRQWAFNLGQCPDGSKLVGWWALAASVKEADDSAAREENARQDVDWLIGASAAPKCQSGFDAQIWARMNKQLEHWHGMAGFEEAEGSHGTRIRRRRRFNELEKALFGESLLLGVHR
jgi:hypothetical protein